MKGTPINCSRGEAKRQELKKTMATCSGRLADVLRHFARRANDTLTVRTLEGRVPHQARAYRVACHVWECREVAATEGCVSVAERLWKVLHGRGEDRPRVPTGQPRGGTKWDVMLPDSKDSSAAAGGECPGDARDRFLPERKILAKAYSHWFGCTGRESD